MKSQVRKKLANTRIRPSADTLPDRDVPPTFGRRQVRQIELSARSKRPAMSSRGTLSPLSELMARLFGR